jgi:hypothetical protein
MLLSFLGHVANDEKIKLFQKWVLELNSYIPDRQLAARASQAIQSLDNPGPLQTQIDSATDMVRSDNIIIHSMRCYNF